MAKRRRLSREDYAVGWVCALPIELAAAQEMLDETHEDLGLNDAASIYTLGRIGEHNVVIACLPKGHIGTNSAATVAAHMKSAFPSICFGLLVGIGGGVPSAATNIRLGDVVVSQPHKLHGGVVQYDFGKSTPSGFKRTGYLNAPPTILLEAVSKIQAGHYRGQGRIREYISHFNNLPTFARAHAGRDVLFDASYQHHGEDGCERCSEERVVKRPLRDENVVIHYGTIASGNQVIRDGNDRDRISSEHGGVLCFEMEAAGLMNQFPCLVIRGICDYADSHKNKNWQPYAAATAAAYVKDLLSVVPPATAKTRTINEIIKENQAFEDALSRLPYAVEAPFNSYQKQHEPTCLLNTRVHVLETINKWADDKDECSIFWLNGWAGTGKSTIARTVARKYFDEQRLGASFFFSRGGGDVGHAGKFVTSIARQLANNIPPLQSWICEAVTACHDIATQSLGDQWNRLVLSPLSKLDSSSYSPYVLVVDALDECEDDRSIQIILQLLTEAQTVLKDLLRIFITSRPNLAVKHGFSQIPKSNRRAFILHQIEPEAVGHDISLFLEHELKIIAQELALDQLWPGTEAIKRLAESASGLFIWCATACRFIREGGIFAEERLSSLLEDTASDTAPEEHLNEIYISILRSSINSTYTEQEKKMFCGLLRRVLGSIVVLSSPLPISPLCTLLQVSRPKVNMIMERLYSILDIPNDSSSPLRLHHPSFRDFLLDKQRCSDPKFWVDEQETHFQLAKCCLKVMNSALKQDICGVGAPGTSTDEVEESQIQQHLSLDVQYACAFWVQHLRKSNTILKDDDIFHQFLTEHCLHWLEALGWMRRVSEGILDIISLESIASKSGCSRLYELIWDMRRLTHANHFIIDNAPLQIYVSALVFAPSNSVVRNMFQDVPLQWMKKLPVIRDRWSPLIQTLECLPDIKHITFLCDGKVLASTSNETVELWDPLTGQRLQTFEGILNTYKRGMVNQIEFLLDGKTLASISGNSVWLWDILTKQHLEILEGHSDLVNQIAISRNGATLASASNDKTVRIWDLSTRQCLRILEGHSDQIRAVVFSSASRFINILASASDDNTIRVWDSSTGRCLNILKNNNKSDETIHTPIFSPDGKILAAVSSVESHRSSVADDHIVQLWNSLTGQKLHTLEGHTWVITAIAFSPDGKLLASSSFDRSIRIWEPASGQHLKTLNHGDWILDITFSPDGKKLASGTRGGKVLLWNPENGQCLQTLEGHTSWVCAIAFSPSSDNGEVLASASTDNIVLLWDTSAEPCEETIESRVEIEGHTTHSPDGKMVASTYYNTVQVWDISTSPSLQKIEHHIDKTMGMVKYLNIYFSPDGRRLASTDDKAMQIWDLSTGQLLRTLEERSQCIMFSNDGQTLASVSADKTIQLWDLSTGQRVRDFAGYDHWTRRLLFSPSSGKLASISNDHAVKLWDISTGQGLQTFKYQNSCANAMAFSPDEEIFASSDGEMIQLWSSYTGKCLQTLHHHLDIYLIAFSYDGRILATASNTSLRLWNTLTGQCVYKYRFQGVPDLKSLSFSEDNLHLNTSLGAFSLNTVNKSGTGYELAPAKRGIFVESTWVSWKGQNLLWFPPEYRPKVTAVYGNVTGLAFRNRQFIFLEFSCH